MKLLAEDGDGLYLVQTDEQAAVGLPRAQKGHLVDLDTAHVSPPMYLEQAYRFSPHLQLTDEIEQLPNIMKRLRTLMQPGVTSGKVAEWLVCAGTLDEIYLAMDRANEWLNGHPNDFLVLRARDQAMKLHDALLIDQALPDRP